MKKLTLLFTALLFVFATQAQKKESRKVGSFDYVSLGVSADLIITQGSSNSLVLEGNPDDLEDIETYVKDGKLKIRNESNSWFGSDKDDVKIYVTIVNFKGASVSGSGNITNSNNLKGGDVNLSVSGSGEIELYVVCKSVDAHISGSGEIELQGSSAAIELHISGSGDMNSLGMEVNTLEAHISGSGSAKVKVKDEIDAHISGSGKIRYEGNPAKIREKVSGSGIVKSL
jgi:putative autotransporter adhesin-like protein